MYTIIAHELVAKPTYIHTVCTVLYRKFPRDVQYCS